MQFYERFDCLSKKMISRDEYKEKLKYLKIGITFLQKCISGNYLNFAICEYYNDQTFTNLSIMTFKAILNSG